MYARVLVPVDGSGHSAEMIPRAAALCALHGTDLVLLRIVDNASDRAAAARETEQLAAQFSARVLCISDSGDIAQAILREATRVPDTLLAMSSHGHSGLMEAVLGSVTLRVVRAGHGPILVYRPDSHANASAVPVGINRVVLPLDGTAASETIAPQAACLAAWIGARLVVVGVMAAAAAATVGASASDLAESAYVRTRAVELAKPYRVEAGWEVLHGHAVNAIVDFVHEDPGTILAMSTRARTALRAALLGSVTSACLRSAGVPMFMRVA